VPGGYADAGAVVPFELVDEKIMTGPQEAAEEDVAVSGDPDAVEALDTVEALAVGVSREVIDERVDPSRMGVLHRKGATD
jgi:hypothetical protein